MSNQELVASDHPQVPAPMFSRASLPAMAGINAGAVSIETERAIAEAQGQLILAKRFPRDLNAAYAEMMEACKLPAMASVAFWSKPQGGSTISGPTIRLAEELARVCGNIEYGHRELSRDGEKSEVEVYAWDKQGNTRRTRQITVMHVIDTKNGPKKCRDQAEIDGLIANKASKQMRSQILSLIPAWLKEAAIEECRKTLAGNNTMPLAERIRKMTQVFAPYGITVKHLEDHLGHPLDQTTSDELVDLHGIYNAIKDGGKPSEFFGGVAEEPEPSEQADKIAAAAAKPAENKRKAPEKPAAEKQAPPPPAAEEKPAEQAQQAPPPQQQAAPVEEPQPATPPQAEAPAPAAEQAAPPAPAAPAQQPAPQAPPPAAEESVF